jgi:hypothetical protein
MVALDRQAVGSDRDGRRGELRDDLGQQLSRLGLRWVTITDAMPGSCGMPPKKPCSASMPPADAPTPTIGTISSLGISAPVCAGGFARSSELTV